MSWICRVLLPLVASLCWSGASFAFDLDDAVRVDEKVQLPVAAYPRESYIRYYVGADIQNEDDLPFTSIRDDFQLKPGELVLGVFVLPGEFGALGEPGVRIARSVAELPYAVHGGCRAVNVVAERNGRLLGSWCNIHQDAPLPPAPKGMFH